MLSKLIWPLRLALAEIREERLFSTGVVLAVCAVLTPIMLLWGAKTGVVDSLRTQLIKDPRIRALRPVDNKEVSTKWLEEMRNDPRVEFILPVTRTLSLYGSLTKNKKTEPRIEVSFIPTGKGDPIGEMPEIKTSFQVSDPVPCMVSSDVAEELNLQRGDRVIVDVSRVEKNVTVRRTFSCKIHEVLSVERAITNAIFLPLPVTELIEDYKDGRAVSAFGWPEGGALPIEHLDALRIAPEGTADWAKFLKVATESAKRIDMKPPAEIEAGKRRCLEFRGNRGLIDYRQVEKLIEQLSTTPIAISVHLDPTPARPATGGPDIQLRSASRFYSPDDFSKVFHPGAGIKGKVPATELTVESSDNKISTLRVHLQDEAGKGNEPATLSPYASAIVATAARLRPVEFSETTGSLHPLRPNYPGFRLYARNLEDVSHLRKKCNASGIEVETEEAQIEKVLALDSGLTKLFLLVACAGIIGGTGVLITNLYLSIERARRQFAALQVLGIPTLAVMASTIIQSATLVLLGLLASFFVCSFGGRLLQNVLGKNLDPGQQVFSLGWSQWICASLVLLSCALVASLLAGSRLRVKDPALIVRSE